MGAFGAGAPSVAAQGSTPEGLHAFQLSAGDGNPDRAFVLAAATAEEKRLWMERFGAIFAAAAAARDASGGGAAEAAARLEGLQVGESPPAGAGAAAGGGGAPVPSTSG